MRTIAVAQSWLTIVLTVGVTGSFCIAKDHEQAATQPGEPTTPDEWTATSIITLIKAVEDGHASSPIARSAWSVALVFSRGTKDSDAKSWIMREWNEAWKNPAEYSSLSAAIAISGDDRQFITPAVWKVWKSTDDVATLTAMAYWIAHFGNDDDRSFLEEKGKSLKQGSAGWDAIQTALSWRRFWDSPHDKDDPGPPHGAPLPY